jgi:hypothetical protein
MLRGEKIGKKNEDHIRNTMRRNLGLSNINGLPDYSGLGVQCANLFVWDSDLSSNLFELL